MQAGKLRHVITIRQRSDTQDSFGQPIPTWSDFATIHARVEPIAGGENLIGRELTANATHRITIRYCAGATAKMQVVWGSRTFDINFVRNLDEKNVTQELICQESV
jgi:SPP1 family predicted phage head-tail adaptor